MILEASGLILLWVIFGGWMVKRWHRPAAAWLMRLRLPWGLRFVLLCTLMAMLEEAVTTGMSNLAVHFGGASPAGMITASTNYFAVIAYHSVIVFIPMYVVWALLLWRWRFTPVEVMLLATNEPGAPTGGAELNAAVFVKVPLGVCAVSV